MPKQFTDAELEHLLSFVGYGDLSAPIWFLGMEEGGAGEENLRRRLGFNLVEDLYEAHQKLGITKHHEGRRYIQRTWRGMCVIMLRLMGEPPSTEAIRKYQAEELGRRGSNTFLLELMPLPNPNIKTWRYSRILPQFNSRDHYFDLVLPKRVEYLSALIDRHQPAVVIGYGKKYWHHYRKLFPAAKWTGNRLFQRSDGSPFVLLTHHFTSRSMNDKFSQISSLVRDALKSSSA